MTVAADSQSLEVKRVYLEFSQTSRHEMNKEAYINNILTNIKSVE
jgi:hypothetical protein